MSISVDPTLRELNDCGCCAGVSPQTPVSLVNRPGLTVIAYRVGTHAQFKSSLIAALADSQRPILGGLKTRDDDDFSIALLDAWAMVADVLAFYQERIANESYLRTATERRSVLELARLLGYELGPGVAASTWLAFTLESAQGAPKIVNLDKGIKAQSLPGPGEKPQPFETIEEIEARVEWNELRPKTTEIVLPKLDDTTIYLKGTSTNLKPGDALVLVGNERATDPGNENWDFRRVTAVQTVSASDIAESHTIVTLDRALGSHVPLVLPAAVEPKVYALRQRANLFGANAPDWRAMPDSVKASYLGMPSDTKVPPSYFEWPDLSISLISDPPTTTATGAGLFAEYYDGIDFNTRKATRTDPTVDFNFVTSPPPAEIGTETFSVRWTGWVQPKTSGDYIFYTRSDDGVRLRINGQWVITRWDLHGPTDDASTPIRLVAGQKYDLKLEYFQNTGAAVIQLFWSGPGFVKEIIPTSHLYPRDIYTVHLDASYPSIVAGSWLVLVVPDYTELYEVLTLAEDSRTNFTLTAKTARLTLRGENLRDIFDERVRETGLFAQSEFLPMAELPLTKRTTGTPSEALTLGPGTLAPVEGKWLLLGKRVDRLVKGHKLIVSGRRLRVKVVQTGTPELKLISPDGLQTLTLHTGDVLQLLESPIVVAGTVSWHLISRDGFEGFAATQVNQMELEPAFDEDETVSEVVIVEEASGDPTNIKFQSSLVNSYDRATVRVFANVAEATHGEKAPPEVLGSGDARQEFQRFVLKQFPVTYTRADSPTGGESTLEVRVNDLKWSEVPVLYGRGPRERVFVTRRDDDGKTTVIFGDGEMGARLPTGLENIKANYRKGIGREGQVKADQISQLMTRPLGVKGVTNPLPASGAQDAQTLADARTNAPLSVLTLERVVSLQDYEDFARNYSGIGKAQARWTWNMNTRGVFVTVAGPEGDEVTEASDVPGKLVDALQTYGNPFVPVMVKSYHQVFFKLGGVVKAEADFLPELIKAAVEEALRSWFSFSARTFGQAVTLSEVLAVIQNVPGVASVDINELCRNEKSGLEHFLGASEPRDGELMSQAEPAELLTLVPNPLTDLEVSL